MKPEDVKPRTVYEVTEIDVPYKVAPFTTKSEHIVLPYIPAHEVGAIIKAALEAGRGGGWETDNDFETWLAKAEELEAMK